MTKTLPERPDLEQLKKQAKELLKDVRKGEPAALARMAEAGETAAGLTLAGAQRVIAREYGCGSWGKLKLQVEAREIGLATARLVVAAANGDRAGLEAILAARPGLGRRTVSAAAVLADVEAVRGWVAKGNAYATTKGGLCDTEALGYVCLGRLGGDETAREACAEVLLAAGANPNATWRDNDWPEGRLPILYAACGRNDYPGLTRRLLAAGANPNDGESIFHAAENNHRACLEALLAGGADLSAVDPKWKNTPLYFLLGWSPGAARAKAARAGILWLLEHGANPNVAAYDAGEVPLFVAVRNGWDRALIDCLLERGADPRARRKDGRSVWAEAVRAGHEEALAALRSRGVEDDAGDADRFLGALARAKETEAREVLARRGELREALAEDVGTLLAGAAKRGAVDVLAVAAALGLDLERPGEGGATALHWAAWHGRAAVVRWLIGRGAKLDARDANYHAAPLGWCVHGSRECRAEGGDYVAVAEALLAAGAELPPADARFGSAEVRAVMARVERGKG